jgi:hypothetical protein
MINKASNALHGYEPRPSQTLHPAWAALIRHCQEMGFGEIERLKIQDGVPVMAERSIQRIKLT